MIATLGRAAVNPTPCGVGWHPLLLLLLLLLLLQ
jgi:hypothetical protein